MIGVAISYLLLVAHHLLPFAMETPKDKLKKMLAWDTAPALTDGEVDELLTSFSMTDKSGLAPADLLWTPTYDLNSAAAAGWLLKAGRATSLVEIDPPGSGLFTSKVFDNCRAMARIYRAKRQLSFSCA